MKFPSSLNVPGHWLIGSVEKNKKTEQNTGNRCQVKADLFLFFNTNKQRVGGNGPFLMIVFGNTGRNTGSIFTILCPTHVGKIFKYSRCPQTNPFSPSPVGTGLQTVSTLTSSLSRQRWQQQTHKQQKMLPHTRLQHLESTSTSSWRCKQWVHLSPLCDTAPNQRCPRREKRQIAPIGLLTDGRKRSARQEKRRRGRIEPNQRTQRRRQKGAVGCLLLRPFI